MAQSKFDERFFSSTRGRIVKSMRAADRTVNELAVEMAITDNAVRAHLMTLERDGLVIQKGLVKGFRKPHVIFGLADEARHLFPTVYDTLLNRLFTGLKNNLSPKVLLKTLREVGKGIARDRETGANRTQTDKLGAVLSTLEELGGSAVVIREQTNVRIESNCCPFADVVIEHPEICKIAETIVAEITGDVVTENCDRTGLPKCRFEIAGESDSGRHPL